MTDEIQKFDKWAFVDEAYSNEFLAKLGEEFDFDALAPNFAKEIRGIGIRYFADIAIFADDPGREERRKEYRRLRKEIADFSKFLARPQYVELASDLFDAALRLREPPPQTDFPELSEFEKTRGAPYLAELQRLLRLLEDAADWGVGAMRRRAAGNATTSSRISRVAPHIFGRICWIALIRSIITRAAASRAHLFS